MYSNPRYNKGFLLAALADYYHNPNVNSAAWYEYEDSFDYAYDQVNFIGMDRKTQAWFDQVCSKTFGRDYSQFQAA